MKRTNNYLGRSVTSETGIQRVVNELEGVGDCRSRDGLEAFADIVADLEHQSNSSYIQDLRAPLPTARPINVAIMINVMPRPTDSIGVTETLRSESVGAHVKVIAFDIVVWYDLVQHSQYYTVDLTYTALFQITSIFLDDGDAQCASP